MAITAELAVAEYVQAAKDFGVAQAADYQARLIAENTAKAYADAEVRLKAAREAMESLCIADGARSEFDRITAQPTPAPADGEGA